MSANMTSRRAFMRGALAAGVATMLPRCVFADVATDARFVLVILRTATVLTSRSVALSQ
jgi:hypothetical protein